MTDPGVTAAATAPVPVFGRTLVLASAGSGKTYQLSSRLVGLLAAGAPPESILASTFTRKAAGEILERVLLRLARAALDGVVPGCEGAARELAESLPPGVPPERTTPEAFRALLLETVGSLHRLQVHTLDAFVHRAVRAFALELGLPAAWEVGDDTRSARLRARALEEVLLHEEPDVLYELVRLVHMGGTARPVHRNLLSLLEEVHGLYRERDLGVESPWGFEGGVDRWPRVPEGRWDEHADRVAQAVRTQLDELGAPVSWSKALAKLETMIRDRDPASFVKETMWQNALTGDPPLYSRKPIHPDLCDALHDLAADLPALIGPPWQRRMEALGRFLPRYDERLEVLRRAEGVFGFDDLVHMLASGGALGRAEELYYRLDGQIRHVLLDEFQDTSSAQWAALAPLADELLSGYEGERAFFVVADPKQSIYGWRGGEPRLVEHLRDRYALTGGSLHRSWRSSPVVLDFVNQLFQDLPANPVLADTKADPADAGVAASWMEGFTPHEAARPELPGYVEVVSGPAAAEGHRGSLRPHLLRAAALRIRDLHRAAPARSIGVLTRRNVVAARLMSELRELGIEASEEGGVPVVDSPPVLAILALLSAADHPADRVSAYLAALSPLGPAEGLSDYRSAHAVERVALRIRTRLLARGYGPVVSEWAALFVPLATPRDARRLDQLVELAFEWEDRATLRPSDFVNMVRGARREDAGAAPVRIMTVHRAKGLEFDIVVLPELDTSLGGRGGSQAVPFRAVPGGPVSRIFPGMPKDLAACFSDLEPAVAQARDAQLRDGLSALYVAFTRARHALHVILPPDGRSASQARTGARLLREAPGLLADAGFEHEALDAKGRLLPEELVFSAGDPAWFGPPAPEPPAATANPTVRTTIDAGPRSHSRAAPVRLAASPRRRLVPRRTPSELEGGDRVSLERLLRPPPTGALDRGTLVHGWLEDIEWLAPEGTPPALEALLERGRMLAPGLARDPAALEALARRLPGWLDAPEVRETLARESWPEGTTVQRERPFVVRDGGGLLQGIADRVLRVPAVEGDGEGQGARLVVVDWKTDRVEGDEALAARADHYRPQMEAYLRALGGLEGIPPERVEGRLVFLEAGRVVRVK
ncbi:hypothetical protein BH23GEM11_BH23GEM11_01490 [soil metagenome]